MRFIALLMFGIITAGPAFAADCKPLQYLGGMPVSIGPLGGLEVQAMLNGKPEMMEFGKSGYNTLTHETVANLQLTEHQSGPQIYSSSGEVANSYTQVASFSLGPVAGKNLQFMVYGHTAETNLAGQIARDLVSNYDVDLDFEGGRINLFSQDHCPDKVNYWPAAAIAAIPFEGSQMTIPVTLDGHATKAMISLSSGLRSAIGLTEATRTFGLTLDSPGVEKFQYPSGTTGYRYTFATLSFEGVTVKNPVITIVPEKLNTMFRERPTGSLLSVSKFASTELRMAIGLDILRKLHVYISNRDHKLYVTAADGKAAALLPPLPNPATP